MSYTEVENVGWFSRIGDSIKGIGCGFLLFIIAFPLLWWNEGRAVIEATGIAAAKKACITVPADKVDPANDGKLIHVIGQATTSEKLTDDITKFETNALRLHRKVEIFQWLEEKKTTTEKKVGGGETKTTKYTYKQEWVSKPVDSKDFKERGHENRGNPPFDDASVNSKEGTLGAFKLGSAIGHFSTFEILPIEAAHVEAPKGFHVEPQYLYQGNNPRSPQVGDVRVSFESVKPAEYTIIAGQSAGAFTDFKAAQKIVFVVQKGNVTKEKVFSDMESANTMLTWVLRAVGFFCMFIGVTMVLKPLSVLADVLPFVGGIVEFGASLIGLLVALPCTFFIIGIAWVAHRPILGISLLVVGGVACFFLFTKLRKPAAT